MLQAQGLEQGRDTPPAILINGAGQAPLLIVCEHASNHIPALYGGLGLNAEAAASHAAWDPGAGAVAEAMSRDLDAPLVAGTVSRLVYDCNRPPDAPDAMPARSERFDIPGNRDLSAADKAARVAAVYRPFETLLAQTIAAAKVPPVLVTVHSFTPTFRGEARRVELGIVHDTDRRFADAMLDCATRHTRLDTRRNDPYGPEDGVTHTLKRHGIANGLQNVMIEIRNDLIADEQSQQAMAVMLSGMIRDAAAALGITLRDGEGACAR